MDGPARSKRGQTSTQWRSTLWCVPVRPITGLGLANRLAKAHAVRVHGVEQAPLLVAAHHALDPKEARDAGAARHRLSPMTAGIGTERFALN